MKMYRNIMIAACIFIASLIIFLCSFYAYNLTAVSNNNDTVPVVIEAGTPVNNIIDILKNAKVIRNKTVAKVYLKLNGISDLKAGTYLLKQNMSLETIIKTIEKGNSFNDKQISITFREGLTIRGIAKAISANTNNSYDSVFALLKDKEYLASLGEKYPFLKETVTNEKIYYPLDGFLFPETYFFESKDVSVKTIIETMLNQTAKILSKYNDDINNNKYTVHELITLASIVQSEGTNLSDMATIASVFYNRLKINDSLGSCVTSYYGVKIDLNERDLYNSEYNASNPYNTRGPGMQGKLPVGPISNPGEAAIQAVLYPEETDYLFFVSDKNRKLYFTKTNAEHEAKKQELIKNGLWYNW